MGGGPGGLEVEAAGDAVDIERFAGEVEVIEEFAFHGFEVDFIEGDAAAGDEFVFIGAFAGGLESGVFEGLEEGVEVVFGEFGPAGGVGDLGLLDELGPEALGDGLDGEVCDGFGGVLGSALLDFEGELVGGEVGEPIDEEFELVIELVELAGAPGGEFQDTGAAEAPVGEEEGAGFLEFGVGDGDLGLGDGDTGEVMDPWGGDIEGEEGGDWRVDGVTELGDHVLEAGVLESAGGDEEFGTGVGFAGGEGDFEGGIGLWGDAGDFFLGEELDVMFSAGLEEGIDDGLGGIGGGEDASVFFGFEGYAVGFEPLDGVLGLEEVEGADEGFTAAGVAIAEGAGVEAGVGDIAAAAA